MGSVIFKKPPLKRLAKESLFGIDMHFHTRYSMDGSSRIASVIKKAKKKGIGVAITDHNNIRGAVSAFRNPAGVTVIPGIEVTCKNGSHLISYFYRPSELEEFFDKELKPKMSNPFFVDLSPADVLELSKDYNCITCAPHPFSPGALGLRKIAITKSMEKNLDLIEVINGYNFRNHNLKAVYWAASLNKGVTGGSDGHTTMELGKVLTFTKEDSINGVFRELLKNKALIIGKERNVLMKAALSFRKGSMYLNRNRNQKMAKTLIKSQVKTEFDYFKGRFKNAKVTQFVNENIIRR